MSPLTVVFWVVLGIWGVILITVLTVSWLLKRKKEKAYFDKQNDPLDALALQLRLGEMRREVNRLRSSTEFSSAHRTRAANNAYDQLLIDACRKAGIELPAEMRGKRELTDAERLHHELELTAHGWSW